MAHRPRRTPLALALLAGAFAALPPSPASAEGTNSLHAGATALQFLAVGGSRTPFRTTGVYVKHHLTARNAVRIGAEFSLDNANGDTPPGTGETRVERDRHHAITVSGEFARYLDGDGPVTMFLGVGPYWTQERSLQQYLFEYPSTYGGIASDYREFDNRNSEVGGSVAAGFEWFFRPKLSLLGRLGASVGFGKRHSRDEERFSDGTSTAISIRRFDGTTAASATSNGILGFAAYF
ncbi:MAG TPA: hypothetical protein VF363_10945 [Candidatus Eisenbacteria bacterium]